MIGRTHLLALVSVALLGVFVLLGIALFRGQGTVSAFGVNQVGAAAPVKPRPAPAVKLSGFDGRALSLADLRGQVVVVNFWASWCAPCRDEAPALEAIARTYRDRGVVFVGVSTWDRESSARAFLDEFGVTYPNGVDQSGEAAVAFGVAGLPETFFVDRDGQIVRRWIGPANAAGLEKTLDELLR